MNKSLLIALLALSGSIVFLMLTGLNNASNNPALTINGGLNLSTKSSDSQVSIELTPIKLVNGKLFIESRFNTHSGALEDYDLKNLVTLELNGELIKPSVVPELKWHHGSGEFVFEIGDRNISEFSIIIKGIPAIPERVFNWP